MKTPERIFEERNWFATEEEMEIVTEMMIEYASQFQSKKEEPLTCGSCIKFVLDGVEFPCIGKCKANPTYDYSKKTTDICDTPTNYKKRK